MNLPRLALDLDLDAVRLHAVLERWPLAAPFRISRGEKTEAIVLHVIATLGDAIGRGEAVPYARYGEEPAAVCAFVAGAGPRRVLSAPPGAARNAVVSALLDLEAQATGVPVHARMDLPAPAPCETAATLSIDEPAAMAAAARERVGTLLKAKLAGDGHDLARVRAVREARPDARLWLDANEGLAPAAYATLAPALAALDVEVLEQPLAVGRDDVLARLPRPVRVCADESAHDAASLDALVGRYDAVNVKLDKTGGLDEAVRTIARARALGFGVVLGCMVSTSLSIAPAQLLAPLADLVDLDGALWLAADRPGGGRLEGGVLWPPTSWGLCGD